MKSILMISLHGYVGANAELGKPDTGGQVVYVLELADKFSRLGKRVDLVTRQFEDQPEYDDVDENFSVWRIPFGGKKFIRKEDMHDHLKKFSSTFFLLLKATVSGSLYAPFTSRMAGLISIICSISFIVLYRYVCKHKPTLSYCLLIFL